MEHNRIKNPNWQEANQLAILQAWPKIWIRDDREQIQQAARAGLESGTTRMTSLTSRPLNRGTGDLVPHRWLRGVDVQMGCIDVSSQRLTPMYA